jgi:hypothetical protein
LLHRYHAIISAPATPTPDVCALRFPSSFTCVCAPPWCILALMPWGRRTAPEACLQHGTGQEGPHRCRACMSQQSAGSAHCCTASAAAAAAAAGGGGVQCRCTALARARCVQGVARCASCLKGILGGIRCASSTHYGVVCGMDVPGELLRNMTAVWAPAVTC